MIPFKPAEDLLTLLAPVAVTLVVLLALAVAVLALLKRFGAPFPARQTRRLKLIERLALSRRTAVLLVECDGRRLLLGESGERISLLESEKKAE